MRATCERRQSILEYLCERRFETIDNLMSEFGASRSTIKRDIEILSLSYPLETKKGTGGGVYVAEGYSLGRKYLSDKQTELLEEICVTLSGEKRELMQTILKQFSLSKGKR